MKKQVYLLIIILLFFTHTTHAVDIAPRISDREIIESLAEIKAEIKSNQKITEQRFKSIDQRFESVDQRFESIDRRFESIDKRFDQQNQMINQRFNGIHKVIDKIWTLMMVVIAGIFGLIGFIVWDRKTALRPLEKRIDNLERDLQHDMELRHEKGSLLTRLVKSLQELAKQDEKVAVVLRNYSLL